NRILRDVGEDRRALRRDRHAPARALDVMGVVETVDQRMRAFDPLHRRLARRGALAKAVLFVGTATAAAITLTRAGHLHAEQAGQGEISPRLAVLVIGTGL